jgi:hypothetical protein
MRRFPAGGVPFLIVLLFLPACEEVKVARLDWIEPLPSGMDVAYSNLRDESGNSFRQRKMDVVVRSTSDQDSEALERRFFEHLGSNGWRLFGSPLDAAVKSDEEGGCVTSFPLVEQDQVPKEVRSQDGMLLYLRLSYC